MGVGGVPLLVGSTLLLAILGPLGIHVAVVLHVFQGFVLFPLGLFGLFGLHFFCWGAFSCVLNYLGLVQGCFNIF
jgi:hypothetical protein